MQPLCELGWLELDPVVSAADLHQLLNRSELRWVFGVSSSSKARESLAASARQLVLPLGRSAVKRVRCRTGIDWLAHGFVQLTAEPLVRRLRCLFFGNDHQDWTEFVLTDLGTFRYESVSIDASSRAFQSREEIEHFHRLNACRARLRAGESAMAVRGGADVPSECCAWLRARFADLQLRLGERLEVEGEPELALATYRAAGEAEGLVKAVRLQERLGRLDAAHRDALAARSSSCTEAQDEALARVRVRLERRLTNKAVERRRRTQPETLDLTLPERAAGQRVERSVVSAAVITRSARVLRREQSDHLVVRAVVLGGLVRADSRRVLPPLPGWAGRSAHRGVSRATRGAVRFPARRCSTRASTRP